jgi:hypothetical protein
MEATQSFRKAAIEAGFVVVNQSPDGTVYGLKKTAQQVGVVTHESLCIDRLTNSATVYCTTAPGKLNSKTFRGVPALQEWLNLGPEAIAQH